MPWPELMRFAVIHCGLTPDAFWDLSLKELLALLPPAAPAPARVDLDKLMQRFPDFGDFDGNE